MFLMARRGKTTIKKWFLGVKSALLGFKNYELASKLEKQNGAKCRLLSQKKTNPKT